MLHKNGEVGLNILNKLIHSNDHACHDCKRYWSIIYGMVQVGLWEDYKTHPYNRYCECFTCTFDRSKAEFAKKSG